MKSELEQFGHAATDRLEYEPDRVFDIHPSKACAPTTAVHVHAWFGGWGGGHVTSTKRQENGGDESCRLVLQANTACHPNDGFDSDRSGNVASMSRRTLITHVFID